MEKKPVWDSEAGVAELINEHKVDVLWDLDWSKALEAAAHAGEERTHIFLLRGDAARLAGTA